MSKTISIHRKLTDFHNKENINHSTNLQQKNIMNNHKYNKRSTAESSLHLNSNLANQLLEKLNENNYAHNLFNETENSKFFKEENPNINVNINIPNGGINPNILINKKLNNNQKFISINDIIGEKCELNIDILRLFFNNFDPSKTSRKNMGVVKSYGVNTYQGIVRNYNEDRVSIIINMNKPKDYNKGRWPKTSFFGIYDGHGGEGCSEYLRDNLHKLICNNEYFPENISEAIKFGISKAEQDFLNNFALSENKEEIIDKSGSCAIIIIIVDSNIYIANVGDSRCLLSMNNGNQYIEVTKDHKPNSPNEIIRIKKNGGNIYQSQTVINNTENMELNGKILIGPYRVLPGRLSVSRTIGDAEAKIVKFGGNPNVIICEPEIFMYDLKKEDIDFFILGCDGIYDQMSNKEVLDCAWMILNEKDNMLIKECKNIHNQSGLIVDLILKSSLARKSFDNVTCLFIALKDLGIKEIDQNEISNDKVTKNAEGISSDNGITPQKIFPITPSEPSHGILSDQNKKNNFEKIYTIKRKSNVLSKQILNENNNNNDEKKCRTNRNDNRYQLLNDNRIMNNNNIFNSDYKLNSLKLNNDIIDNKNELINYQNLSMKDFGTDKNNSNYRKIKAKQNNHKDNNNENIVNNKLSHNKYQTANLIAYSKKNQSFTKINKYLITLNNNNNSKPLNKNNFDNYQTYTNKKISEGNLNKKKNIDINNNNSNNNNNSHIFKPISKFNFNQKPLKVMETKNLSTSSTKNLHLASKNANPLGNINKFNKNDNQIKHGHTKSHRYLMTNKENRNTTFLAFNNNSTFNINNNNKINTTQNEISLNDKLKKKFVNLNEQYKFQSQLMNNSNNSNISGLQNQNLNQRKPKKHLSLNNPANSSMTLNNNFVINNKNINNVFTTRMKRDITSKIRQISMQKALPNNNFRLNHQVNGSNSKHNLSMQIAQLNNKINNYNYADKIQKVKTYKFNNNKNYQNSTFNPNNKKNNDFNNSKKYNNNYLMTDLGISKKDYLYEDNKKNNLF